MTVRNFPTTPGAYQATNAGGYDAFLSKIVPISAPKITAISTDTGASSSDQITTSQNLHISGTSDPSVTVTLERVGLGTLGSVLASTGGTWSYDYSGTTLPEGTYDFVARAANAAGSVSAYSLPEFLVTVDRTAPTVSMVVPSSTTSRQPMVRVLARDQIGIADGTTVTLDVDTNNDGNFTDAGETGYATGVYHNGYANITLPILAAPLLGSMTYAIRARVTDLAGNEGTSPTSTFSLVMTSTSAWVGTPSVASADPLTGNWQAQVGDVSLSQSLDIDQSPGSSQGGDLALVYHSSQVNQHPIVQVTLPTDNLLSLPSSITARLTFNGTAAATVTYSTTGFAPGDVLTMALQSSQAITTTGRYGYSVLVQVLGHLDQTLTGSIYVVAEDTSAYGAGWSLSGVDQLVSIAADSNGPAGMLRVYGSGGSRFYTGTSTFTSPVGDNGTLATSGGNYTYTTPDGQVTTFNGSGYQIGWASADGQALLTYSYDGSQRVSTIQTIDGATGSFTYTTGNVTVQAVNSRTTTLTLSSGNLTNITNPDGGVRTFTLDGNHHITREQFASLENNYAYGSTGSLGTMTWGATVVASVTNQSRWVDVPAVTQGMSNLVAGPVYGSNTDPNGGLSRSYLDSVGNVLASISPEGALTQNAYTNGYLTSETDPLGRTTTYTRDTAGYITKTLNPDGTSLTYQYQSAFHALTTMTDERGDTTTFAYDTSGHQIRETNALGNTTTSAYQTNGLLQSVTDALNHTTTYGYDVDRRPLTTTNALNETTTLGYDGNGNRQTTTDALNHTTTMVNDVMGRPTSNIDALGNRGTVTYDVAGEQLTTTDPLGKQTSLIYDTFKRGLVVESIDGVGSKVQISTLSTFDALGQNTSARDATGATKTMAYSPGGHALGATDALGNTNASYYDLAGQVLASRDVMGRWTKAGYDLRGRAITNTDALGNVGTTAYDAASNVQSVQDALGRFTTYSYDALNQKTGTLDALGRMTTATFDAVGNAATSIDARGFVTSYAFDAVNQATTTTEAVGTAVQRTTQQAFDAVGNVQASQDALGNWTTNVYDALYRDVAVVDPLGHRTSSVYDAVGSVTSVQDGLGKFVTYAYDALHQQISTENQLGNFTTMVLDAAGRQVGQINPLLFVDRTGYNAVGQKIAAWDPAGNLTRWVYDGSGGIRQIIDPVGNETRYTEDGLGRQTVEVDPTGAAATTAYDTVGRVSTATDRDGRTMGYTYDNGDRTTGVVWKSAAGATVNLLTYTYDNNDNVLTAADYNGTVTYSYDALSQVQTYTNTFGQVLTYTHDGNGNVTLRQDSLGGVLTSVYDTAQRLTSKQFGGASQTAARIDFGYNNRDDQTSKTWYSDLAGTTTIAASGYT